MVRHWLWWLNSAIALCVFLLFVFGSIYFFMQSSEIISVSPNVQQKSLPRNPFTQKDEAYLAIEKKLLALKFTPASAQLPDLRRHLIYYGKNGRPDAATERPLLHFGFNGTTIVASTPSGDPLYLLPDKKSPNTPFLFSPENQKTPLWFISTLSGEDVKVEVHLLTEEGELIRVPQDHASFDLKPRELRMSMGGNRPWEIGKLRVDGSLLARQRARWVGKDLFLELHGGEEFGYLQGKERIDFPLDDDDSYSVFVGVGDTMIWKGDRWIVTKPGENTLPYPLLIVKKIEDKLMNMELWDEGGKGKVSLNLIKSYETWAPTHLQEKFQFVGARTRSQYIFEINGERMLLCPRDWLLLGDDGWIKLDTVQLIDDYVSHKLQGVLFVFNGVARNADKPVILATLFNAPRTEMQEIEIPLQHTVSSVSNETNARGEEEEGDDDEEDEIDSIREAAMRAHIPSPAERANERNPQGITP